MFNWCWKKTKSKEAEKIETAQNTEGKKYNEEIEVVHRQWYADPEGETQEERIRKALHHQMEAYGFKFGENGEIIPPKGPFYNPDGFLPGETWEMRDMRERWERYVGYFPDHDDAQPVKRRRTREEIRHLIELSDY